MLNKARFSRLTRVFLISAAFAGVFIAIRFALEPYRVQYWYKERKNDAPIEFFGLVVDGNGAPLPNARVRISVQSFRLWFLFSGELFETRTLHRVTDLEGRFEVSGQHGRSLSIDSVECQNLEWFREKLGFYGNTGYDYSSRGEFFYRPMRDSPAVFPLLKKGEHPTSLPSRGGANVRRWNGTIISEKLNVPEMPKHPAVKLPTAKPTTMRTETNGF